MHFIVTQLGLVFGAPGGHLDRASVSAPRACGSRGLGRLRGGGTGAAWNLTPSALPPAPGCPARSLDKEKDPLLRNRFGILSVWLPKNTGLAIGQDRQWEGARCERLLPGRGGGEGAATGAGKPGRLGHRSAASAGLGSLVVSTSCSGFYSLGFVWKC